MEKSQAQRKSFGGRNLRSNQLVTGDNLEIVLVVTAGVGRNRGSTGSSPETKKHLQFRTFGELVCAFLPVG